MVGIAMQRPALKALVAEASQALARLDAPRLEELAVACQALNRDFNFRAGAKQALTPEERVRLIAETRDAAREMATFARVLEATRANIRVMNRLRELRMGRLEYSDRQVAPAWNGPESANGDN